MPKSIPASVAGESAGRLEPAASAPAQFWTRTRIALLIAGLIILYQVFLPPPVGIANNGDFSIVTALFQLHAADAADPDQYFKYVVLDYRRDNSRPPDFRLITSEHLTGAVAVALNELVSKQGLFDIRVMGFVHAAIYMAALGFLFSSLRNRAMLGLAILVVCDVMPVSHFNSFYTDAGSMIFFTLTAAVYARMAVEQRAPRWMIVVFFVSCLMFVTSKAQHAILGVPLFAFLVWQRHWFLHAGRRLFWLGNGTVLAASLICIGTVPRQYSDLALYNVIFSEILPKEKEPVKALEALGLPAAYVVYSGTGAFEPKAGLRDEKFQKAFSEQSSHGRLLMFYLQRPEVMTRIFLSGVTWGSYQRIPGFGMLPKAPGRPPMAQSEAFSLWTGGKAALFGERPVFFALFFTGASLALLWLAGLRSLQPDLLPAGALLLVICAAIELGFATLADVGETARHLYLFNRMLDAILLGIAACLIVRRTSKA